MSGAVDPRAPATGAAPRSEPSRRTRAIVLVFFAPFMAELVSGSTAPQAWILPWVVLAFAGIYGVSALLIRELALRFNGGLPTVLLLGLAFGILNEGIGAHSLFNPLWPSLGALQGYGRWLGVNWLWAEWIVPFHAVWSISIPIVLVGEFWPRSRTERLLTDRTILALLPVPFATATVAGLIFAGYALSEGDWAGMAVAIVVLSTVGLTIGPRLGAVRPLHPWHVRPSTAFVVGVLFIVAGQVGTWRTPTVSSVPAVGFALVLAMYAAVAAFAHLSLRGPGAARLRFSFLLGIVGFYVALSPVSEFLEGRIGLLFIDAVLYALLIRLYLRRAAEPAHDQR